MTRFPGIQYSSIKSSYIGLAIKIVAKKKRPMFVFEITDEILKYKKVKGKTPKNSISAILQKSPFFRNTINGYVLVKIPPGMNL